MKLGSTLVGTGAVGVVLPAILEALVAEFDGPWWAWATFGLVVMVVGA